MDLSKLADGISLSIFVPFLYFTWEIIAVPSTRKGNIYLLLMTVVVALTAGLLKKVIPSPRPEGAKGCGLYNEETGKENGMPSVHMAVVMFFLMILWIRYHKSNIFWILASIWLGLMAWARWYKECHTPLQILGGVGYGYALLYASIPLMYLFMAYFH